MLASEKRAKVGESHAGKRMATKQQRRALIVVLKGSKRNICARGRPRPVDEWRYICHFHDPLDQVITAVQTYALNRHMATCTEQRVLNQWAGQGSEILTISTKNCVSHKLFLIS
jgi:hypothetical protein